VNYEVVVQSVDMTMIETEPKVKAKPGTRKYPLEIKVSNEETAVLKIEPHKLHGEWDYTVKPRKLKKAKWFSWSSCFYVGS